MAVVKHIGSLSESQILALSETDDLWFEKAFYYPNDYPRKSYFYRILDGELYQIGSKESGGVLGIKLNGSVIGGIKTLIQEDEVLEIPENYDYNTYALDVSGIINCAGQINIM